MDLSVHSDVEIIDNDDEEETLDDEETPPSAFARMVQLATIKLTHLPDKQHHYLQLVRQRFSTPADVLMNEVRKLLGPDDFGLVEAAKDLLSEEAKLVVEMENKFKGHVKSNFGEDSDIFKTLEIIFKTHPRQQTKAVLQGLYNRMSTLFCNHQKTMKVFETFFPRISAAVKEEEFGCLGTGDKRPAPNRASPSKLKRARHESLQPEQDPTAERHARDYLRGVLECPVLLHPNVDPVSFQCGHVTCRKCAEQILITTRTCPLCRKSTRLDSSLVGIPLLKDMARTAFEDSCRMDGCTFLAIPDSPEWLTHVNACPNRLITCKNEGCQDVFKAGEADQHDCPHVPCPGHQFCKGKGKEHAKSCPVSAALKHAERDCEKKLQDQKKKHDRELDLMRRQLQRHARRPRYMRITPDPLRRSPEPTPVVATAMAAAVAATTTAAATTAARATTAAAATPSSSPITTPLMLDPFEDFDLSLNHLEDFPAFAAPARAAVARSFAALDRVR